MYMQKMHTLFFHLTKNLIIEHLALNVCNIQCKRLAITKILQKNSHMVEYMITIMYTNNWPKVEEH